MVKRLSPTMEKSLLAIDAQGGKAIAEGGGWWQGADGERLIIESNTVKDWVSTGTIYALERRGMLVRAFIPGKPYYRDTRLLTDDARSIIAGIRRRETAAPN